MQEQQQQQQKQRRPSLLQGFDPSSVSTPWSIRDSSLKCIPPTYPPLDRNCSTVIVDSTPSVVAVRIAECLQKRSVAVEYDEETITASCMTVDRVHFVINLYQHEHFSQGVIVEIVKSRGDTMSFHWTCRAILNAAKGMASGVNERAKKRPLLMSRPTEFERLNQHVEQPMAKKPRSNNTTNSQVVALEHAATLLKKDRLGAQQLGMESLVLLTDALSSGIDIACQAAEAVLGKNQELHNLVWSHLVENDPKKKKKEEALLDTSTSSRSCRRAASLANTSTTTTDDSMEDAHHGGLMRALALRILTNSLLVLSKQGKLVSIRDDVLACLAKDLQGSSRSPIALAGTKLASPHEAALAAICIKILVKHSHQARNMLQQEGVVPLLEKATMTRHNVLSNHAQQALECFGKGL